MILDTISITTMIIAVIAAIQAARFALKATRACSDIKASLDKRSRSSYEIDSL